MDADKRLGKCVVCKENLSNIGKIFAEIVCEAYNNGWRQGFGSTSIAFYETLLDVRKNKEKHDALMWLVKNGYLYCYENTYAKIWRNKYSCYYDYCNRYGVTKKGWHVAHFYVEEEMEDAA